MVVRHDDSSFDLVDEQGAPPLIATRRKRSGAGGSTGLRRRYNRQLAFVVRRVRPGQARGLSLTVGFAMLALAGWAFGAVTQDVIAGDAAARLDRPVLDWFVAHREPWLTHLLGALTNLGSSAVVVPAALAVGLALWQRRHSIRPLWFLAVTYAGAELLFQAIKHLTARSRPPATLAIGHFSGFAFPSGHATLAVAMWGAISIVVIPTSSPWRQQVTARAVVVVAALTIGITRVYLGAHWLTDVLAGWALGATWLTIAHLATRPAKPPSSIDTAGQSSQTGR